MALETNGTVREARGLTSRTKTCSFLMANWMFRRPITPELPREGARLAPDPLDLVVAERVGRQRAGGVARVDARLLHVLHDPADDHPLAVGDGVHVDLEGVLEELVDQDRVLRADAAPPRVM